MNTIEMLESLSELYSQADVLALEKKELLETLMPPEIREAMEAVEVEYATKTKGLQENIATLEAQVKAAVIDGGESVKSDHLQAVYNKGRVSWDNKKLEGLIIAFPKLAEARKEGDPYVAIRKVG